MRKLLLSGVAASALLTGVTAQAADLMPYKAPPVMPVFSWTGFYIGGHVGGGWGRTDWSSPTGFELNAPGQFNRGNRDNEGFLFGGQIGFNYQFANNWVIGAELDGSWSDIDGHTPCAGVFSADCHTAMKSLATATFKYGKAYGNILLYGKVGGAWAREDFSSHFSFFLPGGLPGANYTASATRAGWTVGTGVELNLGYGWSAKAEYDYIGFGDKQYIFTGPALPFVGVTTGSGPLGIDQNLHVVKLGFNYRPWGDNGAAVAYAGPGPVYKGAIYKAPMAAVASEWTMEAGTRYWYSSGRMQKDLYDPVNTAQLNSRLTYANQTGQSAEAFARWDHRSGVVVKGFFGLGDLTSGKLNDEDFPPGTAPYSNTVSDMKDGRMRYAALDVGYNVINRGSDKLTAFVGYRYFYERANGYGCTQIATNGAVCAPAAVPTSFLGLSETETYRGVAVGLNTQVMLWDRVRLEVDAAYLPYVNRSGIDNHWFRPDINPQIEPGPRGWGAQMEAILSYMVTDKWTVGVGGRYWAFQTTEAYTQFPGVTPVSPMKFYTERYGGFLQASYKFSDADLPFGVK